MILANFVTTITIRGSLYDNIDENASFTVKRARGKSFILENGIKVTHVAQKAPCWLLVLTKDNQERMTTFEP